jgi:hypothetical protein
MTVTRTWNKENDEKMIATLKSCAVAVYVTKDILAARTGIENANAILYSI